MALTHALSNNENNIEALTVTQQCQKGMGEGRCTRLRPEQCFMCCGEPPLHQGRQYKQIGCNASAQTPL
eukprot:6264811-Amphidinium_carterae.1